MKAATQFIGQMAESVSMPDIYLSLREEITRPEANISDFVDIIETDPVLALRVLRIANSDFFGVSREVKDMHQAISQIGVMQLHDVLLSCLCMRAFSSIPGELLNLREFWQYCVSCGIAARVIAQHSTLPLTNRFFALGLLHEIGHAVMYTREPELSLQALDDSVQNSQNIEMLEKQYLGCDYTEIGTALMQLWHLPENYQQVAMYHLRPNDAAEAYQNEIRIVYLAHSICQNPEVETHRDLFKQVAQVATPLHHLPNHIDELIIHQIEQHGDEILTMLWPPSEEASHFSLEFEADE